MLRRFALPVVLLAAAAGTAHADRRAFTNTYEYMTMPDAETELEIYSQQSRQILDGTSAKGYQLELEVEHGITDHWDVALYHVFDQTDTESFHFEAMQLETRYRFAERGEWPVDVELYGEAVKHWGQSEYEGEGRLILGRDLGPVTIAANAIGAVEFGKVYDEPEVELGWAGGATYEVAPELKVGAESWGNFEAEKVSDTIAGYAGPSLSWAPTTSLWVAVTPGFGITSHADDVVVRLALGLHIE